MEKKGSDIMELKEIQTSQLHSDAFTMIGKEWMLVSAERDGVVNTMTASWGGMGILWNKKVAFVFLRPQRYTKEFIDQKDCFTLSFYDEEYRKTLSYLGTVSGRDEQKIEKAGLHTAFINDAPYFTEANTVLVCRKLYAQEMREDCFLDAALIEKNYPHHGAVAFGHHAKALYEVFKYVGVPVEEIGYNQPKGVRYPTENPWG